MSPGPPGRRPRRSTPLVADAMLGRLARWLRALGRDVVFDADLPDDALVRIARADRRLLLTRDRRLCTEYGSPDWCRLVEARRPKAQLLELAPFLDLFAEGWRGALFSRCMVCNTLLERVDAEAARGDLPPEVRSDPRVRSAGFRRCPACPRVYWDGSHTRRMRRWLNDVAAEV